MEHDVIGGLREQSFGHRRFPSRTRTFFDGLRIEESRRSEMETGIPPALSPLPFIKPSSMTLLPRLGPLSKPMLFILHRVQTPDAPRSQRLSPRPLAASIRSRLRLRS